MNAMLLAAGFGTRFRPHTDVLAKPAIPFLNLPMLAYPLSLLETLPVDKLVINTHHLPGSILDAIKSLRFQPRYFIIISNEQPEILNSAGGIGRVRSDLRGSGDFIVGNADTPLLLDHSEGLKPFLMAHQRSGALATLFAVEHETLVGRGLWVDDQGEIKGIGSTAVQGCRDYRYPGLMVCREDILNLIPQKGPSHIFDDVLLPAMKKGALVKAHIEKGLWLETGSEADYLQATSRYLDILWTPLHPYHNCLNSVLKTFQVGNKMMSPAQLSGTDRSTQHSIEPAKILVGAGTYVEKDVEFSGFCVLGPGLNIPTGCHLSNSVILSDKELAGGAVIENRLVL